jgi:hypothetical protein
MSATEFRSIRQNEGSCPMGEAAAVYELVIELKPDLG